MMAVKGLQGANYLRANGKSGSGGQPAFLDTLTVGPHLCLYSLLTWQTLMMSKRTSLTNPGQRGPKFQMVRV
jgi:hypothetical protein